MGRPRSIVDVALAVRLVGRGYTDRAAARVIGVSPWTMRLFRRTLSVRHVGGRPRSGEPDLTPPRSRPALVAVRDEGGRLLGHRIAPIAA